MKAKIRKANTSDSEPIAVILRELGWFDQILSDPLSDSAERVRLNIQMCLADQSHSIYVAENENGEVLGYVTAHWLPYLFLPGPEGFITELFVRASARGQKIGTGLLEVVKAEARERDCFRLSTLNRRNRESYQRLFLEKNGWETREGMVNFIYWM